MLMSTLCLIYLFIYCPVCPFETVGIPAQLPRTHLQKQPERHRMEHRPVTLPSTTPPSPTTSSLHHHSSQTTPTIRPTPKETQTAVERERCVLHPRFTVEHGNRSQTPAETIATKSAPTNKPKYPEAKSRHISLPSATTRLLDAGADSQNPTKIVTSPWCRRVDPTASTFA